MYTRTYKFQNKVDINIIIVIYHTSGRLQQFSDSEADGHTMTVIIE